MSRGFTRVTRSKPCPICGKPDYCAWTGEDGRVFRTAEGKVIRIKAGSLIRCERIAFAPPGWLLVKPVNSGGLFAPADAEHVTKDSVVTPRNGRTKASMKAAPTKTSSTVGFAKIASEASAAIDPARKQELAKALGVTAEALTSIGCGWVDGPELRKLGCGFAGDGDRPDGCYCFPERCGDGRVVGLSLRATDGRKGSPKGAARGLIVPSNLGSRPDPVIVCEGASDTAALEGLGIAAVGRPSNSAGAEDLARLLEGRAFLILGENDQKPSGAWPGRDGAKSVASRLAASRGEAVLWSLPPDGAKDVRGWLNSKIKAGLDLGDGAACKAAGQELLAALKATAREIKPERRSQADSLVELAGELYTLGRDLSDSPFATLKNCHIAIPFGGKDALRRQLAKAYKARSGKVASTSALGDAMLALGGAADDAPRSPVYLRVARTDDAVVIDLGDETGRVIIVTAGGWSIEERSPVLFRRSNLTCPLPEPARGGNLDQLFELLNVAAVDRPILRACLVAALFENIAHPILLLTGLQGAGKSTAERMLATLIDPSSSALQSPPRDIESWAMICSAGWCVPVDNVSTIPPWWSDALCRAVSGDGFLKRRLYTDQELSILAFRRVVMMTSIDPGSLRGDLCDRLLSVELDPIDDNRRRSEADILRTFEAARPALLGGLLDVLVVVLRRLPEVHLDELPRMADFGLILAALDAEFETDGLDVYLGQRDRQARDVIEGDPVGQAIVMMMMVKDRWAGTSTELLAEIKPKLLGPERPRTGKAMSGRLRRLIPALARLGIRATPPATDRREGGTGRRVWSLERMVPQPSHPSHRHENPPCATENRDLGCDGSRDGGDGSAINRHIDRHEENRIGATENRDCDGCDGSDGCGTIPSEGEPIPDGWREEDWAAVCAADLEGLPGEPMTKDQGEL